MPYPFYSNTDIYIVADLEGNEMVLKLHRYDTHIVKRRSYSHATTQARSCLLSCNQGEERLHGKTEIGFMDVHVATSSSKGVGFHEGNERVISTSQSIGTSP